MIGFRKHLNSRVINIGKRSVLGNIKNSGLLTLESDLFYEISKSDRFLGNIQNSVLLTSEISKSDRFLGNIKNSVLLTSESDWF